MNVGDYGVVFRLNVSFDISGFSTLTLTFTKPDKTTLVVNSGITVGNIDVVTPDGTFLANQYALYTFTSGQVDQSGNWSARLTYVDSLPRQLISNPATFTVSP